MRVLPINKAKSVVIVHTEFDNKWTLCYNRILDSKEKDLKMSKFTASSILWTKEYNTKPDANETVAKGIIKAVITADINSGKSEYTLDEILALFELAYSRSKAPAKKAKLTWTNFAKPGKEGWFTEI